MSRTNDSLNFVALIPFFCSASCARPLPARPVRPRRRLTFSRFRFISFPRNSSRLSFSLVVEKSRCCPSLHLSFSLVFRNKFVTHLYSYYIYCILICALGKICSTTKHLSPPLFLFLFHFWRTFPYMLTHDSSNVCPSLEIFRKHCSRFRRISNGDTVFHLIVELFNTGN